MRRCVSPETGTPRRARVPPVDYLDAPGPRETERRVTIAGIDPPKGARFRRPPSALAVFGERDLAQLHEGQGAEACPP